MSYMSEVRYNTCTPYSSLIIFELAHVLYSIHSYNAPQTCMRHTCPGSEYAIRALHIPLYSTYISVSIALKKFQYNPPNVFRNLVALKVFILVGLCLVHHSRYLAA